MAVRLLEMRRLLKSTGSVYLHCDPTASHYLKLIMDCIFGKANFQNEIIWWYGGGGASKKRWGRKHDVLLFYTRDKSWTFNTDEVRESHKWVDGQRRADGSLRSDKGKLPDDVFHMHGIMPWAKERTGYPTQKPLALLERIVKASSKKGAIVFDPFCGCATALVAAEKLQREWVGVDLSPLTVKLVNNRLSDGSVVGVLGKVTARQDIPQRTDLGRLPPYTKHKTLLYGQCAGNCGGCGVHFEIRNLEIDHVVPRAKGGTDHVENLQLLCGHCNRTKGKGTQEHLKARLRQLGIIG